MDYKFWRKKWLLAVVIITIIVVATSLFLVTLKVDYDTENGAKMLYFTNQPGMPDAFAAVSRLTPSDAVVFCWWDYGQAVNEWSNRQVIEAYPSREIADSMGSTRSIFGNLGAQLFGKWGSNERIQDLASAFMLNEEQSLQILRKYNATYALVFVPDEVEKFGWIAQIAGYNATEYLAWNETTLAYEPTTRGAEVTLLRLVYDDTWQPRHFTKVFDNEKAKIYKINY
jgi:hypothetical protein